MLRPTNALNALLYARYRRLSLRYRRRIGRFPNYWSPVLFSEKVQWRKLFDRNPAFPLFLDKLKVRSHVTRTAPGLGLPELLWSGTDPAAIPYDQLGSGYVVKPNCRSGAWHFVLTPADADSELIEMKCRRWLEKPYGRGRREWAYGPVERRLLVEEVVCRDSGDDRVQDFRFDVFDGRVRLITVTMSSISETRRAPLPLDTFYDRNWQQLPFIKPGRQSRTPPPLKAPAQLEDMIAWAERLGNGLDYIRVDMYRVEDRTFFSELTVYPGSGMMLSAVTSEAGVPSTHDFDIYMGRHWRLPSIPASVRLHRALFG